MEAELDSLDEAESVRRLVEDALKYMSFRAVRLKFLFLRFIKDGTDDAVEEALEDEYDDAIEEALKDGMDDELDRALEEEIDKALEGAILVSLDAD